MTSDGRPLGVMMVCGHRIDGATLHVDSDDVDKALPVGSWTADRPRTAGLTTWPLVPPSPGWTADPPLAPLSGATAYVLHGWTTDNSHSARAVSFTSGDLKRLTPKTVRYHAFQDTGEESAVTVTMDEFEAGACTRP